MVFYKLCMHACMCMCLCVFAVKASPEMVLYDGQILGTPVKQLSIVAPSKKRIHGQLQKQVQV